MISVSVVFFPQNCDMFIESPHFKSLYLDNCLLCNKFQWKYDFLKLGYPTEYYTAQHELASTSTSSGQLTQLLDDCVSKLAFKPGKPDIPYMVPQNQFQLSKPNQS